MYFNIAEPLVRKKVTRLHRASFLASQALLVKMLITLEPHGIFVSNFVYLCILTLFSQWYEKGDEALPSIILAD